MPLPIDFAPFVCLVALGFWDHLYEFPRFRRALQSGRPHARLSIYRRITVGESGVTAVVLAVWLAEGRRDARLPSVMVGGIVLLATIAVLGQELNWKRAALIVLFTVSLALLLGGVAIRVLPLLGL